MTSSRRKRIYTKYGDEGQTGLLYGGRVSKNDPHTEAYGVADEAVSTMGLARALSQDDRVQEVLKTLQRELFTVAAELATDPQRHDLFKAHFKPVTAEMVVGLEELIDQLGGRGGDAQRLYFARGIGRLGSHRHGPVHRPYCRASVGGLEGAG